MAWRRRFGLVRAASMRVSGAAQRSDATKAAAALSWRGTKGSNNARQRQQAGAARRGESGSHGSARRQPEAASDAARARAAPTGQRAATGAIARTESHDVEAARHGDRVQPGKQPENMLCTDFKASEITT